jgi:hypothetical protein
MAGINGYIVHIALEQIVQCSSRGVAAFEGSILANFPVLVAAALGESLSWWCFDCAFLSFASI